MEQQDEKSIKEKLAEYFKENVIDIGEVSPGCYHIGGGVHTGKGGWDLFCERLEKNLKKDLEKIKDE